MNPLSLAAVARIVAPFDEAEAGVSMTVEDSEGRVLATAGAFRREDDATRAVVAREIHLGEAILGRLIVRGEARSIVEAVARSLAAGLEALAEAATEAADGAVPSTHGPHADASQRLTAELALGRRIQRSFVPLVVPDIPGYDVASHYEAAHEVGGDFFDVFRVRGRAGRLAVVIADVTGKGVAAALLMAFARPLLHAAIDNAGAPVDALERTNRILVAERRSPLFITALCAIVELRTGRMRLANAGHEPPLIVPRNGEPIRWLTGSGPLLGVFDTVELPECGEELEPGDLALLYTDGVTDARAASGERFGDDRLVATVEEARGRPAGGVVEAVTGAIAAFQGTMPPADDVTIVAVRRNEPRRGRSTRP